jgi:sugar phosphate isomerase/epimerase
VKLSLQTWTLAGGVPQDVPLTIDDVCRLAHELEVDGVDWVGSHGFAASAIRRAMDAAGLRTVCYTFMPDINVATVAERVAAREVFVREIDTAVRLGAPIVMLPVDGKPGVSRADSFRRTIDTLGRLLEIAECADITVALEHFPLPTSPFITSDDLDRAVAELPALRVTCDLGNVTTGGEGARDGYLANADHVVHVHAKDFAVCDAADAEFIALDGRPRTGVLLGDGDVDIAGAIAAMAANGYSGYIDFEYNGTAYTAAEACRIGISRLRRMIEDAGQ